MKGKERNEVDLMLKFIKRHWKAILIAVVAIVLIIVVINVAFSSTNDNTTVTAGTAGIASLDGSAVGVFDNQSDAEANKVTVDAGVKILQVTSDEYVEVSATVGGFPVGVTNTQEKTYEVDTSNLGDGSTVIVQILIGGDGSFVGRRLNNDVDTYYLAINVNNPNQTTADSAAQTAQALGLPNGKMYVGEDKDTFQTYGSESEAQQAVAGQQNNFTLPKGMVQNGLSFTVEPTTDDTARVMVKVCMMDGESVESIGKYVSPDSNWAGTLDVSNFAGHQITICIKAENGWAISNGYSYVSFFLPPSA